MDRETGWWASEDRWFNRDLPTRIILILFYPIWRLMEREPKDR